jgi:hypothetical protein
MPLLFAYMAVTELDEATFSSLSAAEQMLCTTRRPGKFLTKNSPADGCRGAKFDPSRNVPRGTSPPGLVFCGQRGRLYRCAFLRGQGWTLHRERGSFEQAFRLHRCVLELHGAIGQANVLIAFALGNDPVIEPYVRCSFAQFMYLERGGRLPGGIETLAVAVGREIHVVVHVEVDGLRKDVLQLDGGRTIRELARAEILEPVLGGIDGVQRHHPRVLVDRN